MDNIQEKEETFGELHTRIKADLLLLKRDWEQQPIIERLDKIKELLEKEQ